MEKGHTDPKASTLWLAVAAGVKQGQHLVYENDRTPLCNLHVTLMQSMGLERDHFVDGKERLTGLS